jgi:hypothetical protein
VRFFLDVIIQQARENQEKASSILSLYEDKKKAIVDLARSQYSVHALDFIFSKPIFQSTEFTHISIIPKPTANRILAVLRDNGICEILRRSSGRRPAIYVFPELINITEGKKIF